MGEMYCDCNHYTITVEIHRHVPGSYCTNIYTVLSLFIQVLDDDRFAKILSQISTVVHDDTHYQRGALNMKTQKCFCVKDGLSGKLRAKVILLS